MFKQLKPTTIDLYIIKKFFSTFFFTLLIFVSIAVVFDYAEKIDDFMQKNAPMSEVLSRYYLNFIPYYSSTLSPLLIFIATIFFTSKMANNTEIVPILSGGISFYRYLYPYFLASALLGAFIFITNGYILPLSNKKRIEFEKEYSLAKNILGYKDLHFSIDDSTYAYIQSFNLQSKTGYKFYLERFNGSEIKSRLIANSIVWDSLKSKWLLKDYSIRDVMGENERMTYGSLKDTLLPFQPNDFNITENNFETMTNPGLNAFIEKEQSKGLLALEPYYMERARRYAMPFSALVLTLLGVSLSSRKVRGGIGAHLGFGIFCSFVYLIAIQFTTVFAVKGGLNEHIAAWLPNLFFGLFSFYLIKVAPK